MARVLLVVLSAVVSLTIFGAAQADSHESSTPIINHPTTTIELAQDIPPDILTIGATVYAANCTRCHGESAQGDGELVQSGEIPNALIDFTDPTANDTVSPAEWFEVITNGRLEALMPPWDMSLTENERWSVALYLYTLSYSVEQRDLGAELYSRECAECHGEGGAGTADGASLLNLIDQTDDGLFQQISEGLGENMPAFADTLTEEERTALVTHVRSLGFAASVEETAAVHNNEPPTFALGLPTSISGTIQHGTAGGELPESIPVTLHLMNGTQGDITLETTANADGTFTFSDLELEPQQSIVASVMVNDGTFVSQFVRASDLQANLDLPVTIYDLTYEPNVLRIATKVSQIFPAGEEFQVIEIIEVWNDSDRIYMGTSADDDGAIGNQTVSFTLPEGATYMDITGDGRFSVSADGRTVIDSLPVLPGEPHVVHIMYSLPADDNLSIVQPLDYRLEGRFELHMDSSLEAESDLLVSLGTFPSGDSTVNAYATESNLPAGSSISYDIAVINAGSSSILEQSTLAAGLLGVGVLMIVTSGVMIFLDRRKNAADDASFAGMSADELLTVMANLDMAYEAGEINQRTHSERRAKLKAQLAVAMKAERD